MKAEKNRILISSIRYAVIDGDEVSKYIICQCFSGIQKDGECNSRYAHIKKKCKRYNVYAEKTNEKE